MDELLAAIAKMLGEGKTAADIGKAIQTGAGTQPIYQYIFDRGHSDATQRAKEKQTELEGQITALTTERDEKATALIDLQSKTPEVKTVTEQFQREINTLKEQHKAEKAQWGAKMNEATLKRTRSDLKANLVAKGVDADYADVLVNKEEIKARMRPNDAAEVEIMADGRDIPLTAGEGQTALGLFTDELVTKVPAKFLTSSADRGSDTRNTNGGPNGSAQSFEALRKDVADRHKTPTEQGITAIASRMGTSVAGV